MRINSYVALATGLSRRRADTAIAAGQVSVNNVPAQLGTEVKSADKVTYKGRPLYLKPTVTLILNKPVGYVCSRRGQGSQTIYALLPPELQQLKPVGRLDKDSSGLLLLTNDGQLANQLTHPKHNKAKHYEVTLDKPLTKQHQQQIELGIKLDDGSSKLALTGQDKQWTVTLSQGRNRQIRRTFAAAGYKVIRLHRTEMGPYKLTDIPIGKYTYL